MIESVQLLCHSMDQCSVGEGGHDVRGPRVKISAHKEETNASEGGTAAHDLMRLYDLRWMEGWLMRSSAEPLYRH